MYDPATEQVHVLIQENSTAVLHAVSRDFGETWSTPVQITISSTFAFQLPGCAHGIVVQGSLCSEPTCGGTAGRLLLPFVCHAKANGLARARATGDVACPGCFSCIVWSDDHGATWAVGAASTQEGTRESGLAQLVLGVAAGDGAGAPAAIYASERNMGATPGTREHAVSLDSGASFSSFGTDPGIPDVDTKNWTGVVAGVTRFDTAGSCVSAESVCSASGSECFSLRAARSWFLSHPRPAGHHERVVITTPAGPNARANLSVFFSIDETASWSPGSVLVPGPAGYSDAVQLNGTAVGVLFENGADEFAEQISFGCIAVADL